MRCRASGGPLWALALVCWLVGSCTPLPAQSPTPSAPGLGWLSPSERQLWAKVSEQLLTRLTERSQTIADLQASLQTLGDELTTLLQASDALRMQLAESETSRQAFEAELTATSNSLDDSRKVFLELTRATDEAHKADQRSLEAAMVSRDMWMLGAISSAGAAVLFAILAFSK